MPKQPAKRRPISQRQAQRYFKVSSAAQFVPPKDEPVPRIDRDEENDADDVDAKRGVKAGATPKR